MVTKAALLVAFACLARAAAGAPELFVEAELAPARGLVHAQADYVLRLYQAVPVEALALNGPRPELAELRPMGEARVFEADREGRRYRVTERRWAVFPIASGALVLGGAQASGTLSTGRAFRLEAPPRTLEVNPVPSEAGRAGPWLPARALALVEAWPDDGGMVRAGQPLVRVVRVEAAGVDAARLPPLAFEVAGAHVHGAPPRLENRVVQGENVGVREERFEIVPRAGGELRLSEMSIHWWDVGRARMAVSTLPPRNVVVAAGISRAPEVPAQASAPADRPGGAPQSEPVAEAGFARGAGAVLGLAGVLALAWTTRGGRSLRVRTLTAWRLRRACLGGDPRATQRALLAWAAARGLPSTSLRALAGRLDGEAGRAVAALERHVYGPPGALWSGRGLASALSRKPA